MTVDARKKIPKEVKIHCLSQDRHISCIVGVNMKLMSLKCHNGILDHVVLIFVSIHSFIFLLSRVPIAVRSLWKHSTVRSI